MEPWYCPWLSQKLRRWFKRSIRKISYFIVFVIWTKGPNCEGIKYEGHAIEKGKCTFFIKRQIKTAKPGFHPSPIVFSEYPSNRKICIVTTITHYLEITKDLWTTDRLIISCTKPRKAVTTSTFSSWCKVILGKAGIDIEKYSLHSTRSASTSKAKIKGLSLSETNKAAGWKETSTFKRFYDKPIFKIFGDLLIRDMLWLTKLSQDI